MLKFNVRTHKANENSNEEAIASTTEWDGRVHCCHNSPTHPKEKAEKFANWLSSRAEVKVATLWNVCQPEEFPLFLFKAMLPSRKVSTEFSTEYKPSWLICLLHDYRSYDARVVHSWGGDSRPTMNFTRGLYNQDLHVLENLMPNVLQSEVWMQWRKSSHMTARKMKQDVSTMLCLLANRRNTKK